MPENKNPKQLRARLKDCMRSDYFRFSRRLAQLEKKPDAQRIDQIALQIEASCERKKARLSASPNLQWPNELPVCASRKEILDAIKKHQIILVCGETGSGKTTQLPKICLQAGRGIQGTIGHTQPRRLAARAVATRLSQELQTPMGHLVGFQTRFQQQLSDSNLIKIMTDGILLAEIQQDRWLNRYDTIIIDEAHERSLNIDFLLGYLKQLLKKRRDLKLIITSATIDAERIAQHFDHAPIIEVSGKTYPVEIRYGQTEYLENDNADLSAQIDNAIDELQAEGRGDVLVFLPGEREIHETYRALRHRRDRFELLPLYARLPASEQQKIFRSGGRCRIILTTNVAETSLTVPGIRYVIDTGLARISRYSWRTKVQRLPTEKISQASANQRAGRCGRTAPGICIRLYAEDDFQQRPEFTDPEIMRTNLASVILQMSAQNLGAIEQFPFIDKPDPRLIKDGFRLLQELKALDHKKQLSQSGRMLARLPIDPRFGRMLQAASEFGSVREVLAIVTALTIRDPRERPHDKQQAADEKHEKFNDVRSDFIAIYHLWQYLEDQNEALSQSRMRKLCQQEFFSYRRWREWRDLHRQVKLALQDQGIRLNQQAADYDNIHSALLSGLLDHVGFREEKQQYLGARNRKMYIFPGSGIGSKLPKWLMAAEISETSRLYARTVASIQPQWVEKIGAHLLRHHYSEPHWQKRAAKVGGFEKLTLYGLIINPRRAINYSQIDPVVSRELFIRHALIYGEWNHNNSVIRDNLQRMSVIEDLEIRLRRRDLLADETVIFDFYNRVLPAHIHSGASFEKWYRNLKNQDLLYLSKETLLQDEEPDAKVDNAFPLFWKQGNLRLTLSYRFEPGQEDDGVSLLIPLPALRQVDPARCEWLVPGLLEEKILALIKALPKRLRKHFVPAPDFTRAALENLQPCQGSLLDSLSQVLGKMTGTYVSKEEWNLEIPTHLLMRFIITGKNKKILGSSRDLVKLQTELADSAKQQKPEKINRHLERDGITDWDFGELPDFIDCKEDGYQIRRFPALVASQQDIALKLFDLEEEAKTSMRSGLRALLRSKLKDDIRYLDKNLPNISRHCLRFSAVGNCTGLKNDLIDAAIDQAFQLNQAAQIRDAEMFLECLESGRGQLIEIANHICDLLEPILANFQIIRKDISGNLPLNRIEAIADIKSQLDNLVFPGFILQTPSDRLSEIPRYLAAILKRLEKLDQSPDRDRRWRVELEPFVERLEALPEAARKKEDIQHLRWLLEELRVSLFAQELGTRDKVSPARLEKLWKKTQATTYS